jgi:hypothetical protein
MIGFVSQKQSSHLKLVKIAGLVLGSTAPHIFLNEGRMFKGQYYGVRWDVLEFERLDCNVIL